MLNLVGVKLSRGYAKLSRGKSDILSRHLSIAFSVIVLSCSLCNPNCYYYPSIKEANTQSKRHWWWVISLLPLIVPSPKRYTCTCSQKIVYVNYNLHFTCTFFPGTVPCLKEQDTPIHICSLDAGKCFDRICHDGLFAKLCCKTPVLYWRLFLEWCKKSNAFARKGTWQSILIYLLMSYYFH